MNKCILLLLILLQGCATSYSILLDENQKYKPTKSVELLTTNPEREFIQIGIIETKSGYANEPFTALINSARTKAKAIGADAILLINNETSQTPQGVMYNPYLGGYQTIGGVNIQTIKFLAIKWK